MQGGRSGIIKGTVNLWELRFGVFVDLKVKWLVMTHQFGMLLCMGGGPVRWSTQSIISVVLDYVIVSFSPP